MQNRRQFIKNSALVAGSSFFPSMLLANRNRMQKGAQYLLQIHYDLGLSTCAMFDARPNIFTATGVFHNYLLEPVQPNNQDPLAPFRQQEAIPYPSSMGKGYYSPILADFIRTHGKDIAILNGVHMSENDGHDQNRQSYLTSNTLRSNLFLDFTRSQTRTNNSTYSALILQTSGFNIAELSKYLVTRGDALQPMLNMFRSKAPKVHFDPRFSEELKQNFASFASAEGAVKIGADDLWKAGIASDELIDVLRSKQQTSQSNATDFTITLSAIHDSFAVGLSNHAVLQLALNTDSHDAGAQRQKLQTIATVARQLNDLVTWLKNTPAPNKQSSMFEQTVITVAGEFDRTTRNDAHANGHNNIFATGSDHNQFNNTILVFGGGLKGGQVIGETDLDILSPGLDIKSGASGYGQFSQAAIDSLKQQRLKNFPIHMQRNEVCNRAFGKPWDFTADSGRGGVRQSFAPDAYDRDHYITIQSIHNTILEHFGFREAFHHANSLEKTNKAKILPRLLG